MKFEDVDRVLENMSAIEKPWGDTPGTRDVKYILAMRGAP